MDPQRDTREVHAELQYLDDSAKHTEIVYYASQAGDQEEAHHQGQFRFQTVSIHNARNKPLSIDREGFQLVRQESAVGNFLDDDEIALVYNAEIEHLLVTHIPGATRVHIFDHTRRASTPELRKKLKCREPTSVIHNDYTEQSAVKRLRDMLGDEAADLLKKRFSIVNVWRSMAGTVEAAQMTFCDSTTLRANDLVSVKRIAKDRIGELQLAFHNPNHQWYFFPTMTMKEAAIFKTYDTVKDGSINRFTLHSSFTDPNIPPNAPPRQSIETRAFVFYETDTDQPGGLFRNAYSVQTPDDNVALYKVWATEYDKNMVDDLEYVAPARTVDIFQKYVEHDAKLLDAGCGTGLVGEELKKKSYSNIDGLDISQEMLNVARSKNIYGDLEQVDMTQPLPYQTGFYGACICVGTLTHGHVPPSAIGELVRIVKPGGFNVFTVHEQVWQEMGFDKKVDELEKKKLCEIVEISKVPYIEKKGYQSYTVVLRTL